MFHIIALKKRNLTNKYQNNIRINQPIFCKLPIRNNLNFILYTYEKNNLFSRNNGICNDFL